MNEILRPHSFLKAGSKVLIQLLLASCSYVLNISQLFGYTRHHRNLLSNPSFAPVVTYNYVITL